MRIFFLTIFLYLLSCNTILSNGILEFISEPTQLFVCQDESVELSMALCTCSISGGSGNYNYSWSPNYLVEHPDPSSPEATLLRVVRSADYYLTVTDVVTSESITQMVVMIRTVPPKKLTIPSQIVHRFKAEDINEPINLYDLFFGAETNITEYLNDLFFHELDEPEIEYCFKWVDRFSGEIFENAYEYIPQPNSQIYLWFIIYGGYIDDGIIPPPAPNGECLGCEFTRKRINIIVRGNLVEFEFER